MAKSGEEKLEDTLGKSANGVRNLFKDRVDGLKTATEQAYVRGDSNEKIGDKEWTDEIIRSLKLID